MSNRNSLELQPRMMSVIIIAIVLFFISIFFLVAYWNGKSDMYLMPYGFSGKVTVFYDQPDCVPEKREGERRIFEIPATGILYTQSPYKKKWDTYYYVQPDGKLEQLTYGSPYLGHSIAAYSLYDTLWVTDVDVKKIKSGNQKKYVETYYVVGKKR